MATFYIQLEDRLLQISGELTAENISKALGYVPVSSNVTNELSQRVNNITFDSLKDNPFLQDGSGELNIVDEAGNIIAKIDAEGIHSVDFIAGNHKLTDKIDSSALNGYAKESWVSAEIAKAATEGKIDLTGYATEEWVEGKNYLTEHQDLSHLATKQELQDLDFYAIKDNPIVNNGDGKLLFADENGYIGLQLESDGLYVKEVIAEGHKLTEKANKSELSNYATKAEVSDLVDMSVVEELQGKVEILVGEDTDKSVRDIANDELIKQLLDGNDNFQTLQELSAWIDEHPDSAATMNEAIQKNAEDIIKTLASANEYTDNINFYTIKDNPIVDGEAGSITFVDETGYIGLKVTEDGIIAKDVVTPEHTLSSKADKSFVEDNYYNKSTVDKKIAEAVTGGQVSLDGFATEQWVNEQGFLKTHQDISHLAEKSELPKKVSDLENDKGYLTEHQDISHLATKSELPTVPTKVSELENDSKFITIDEVPEVTVPTKTSDLTNDSGFITLADVPVQEIPEEYITETELNDKGFLTEHQDISHLASRNWVESQGYAHQEDLLEISFNDIQDSPISIDDSGMINFVDESGNVGFQINEEGLRVSEVIVGEHKLSEKANVSDIPSLDGYAKTEDLPDFSEFAKLEDIPETPSLDGYATQEWVNNKNYATEYDLKTIDFSSINNVPLNEDASGEFSIVDESGNVGMKVSSDAVYAKDFISGEHILSNKQDSLISGYNIKTLNGESILGEGDIVISGGGEQDLSEYAKKSEIPTKISQLTNDSGFLVDDIDYSKYSNGVYAGAKNGELIDDFTTVNSSCIGVALITDNQKVMIAKKDAAGGRFWGYNLAGKNLSALDDRTDNESAMADFDGKNNTDIIIKAYSEYNVAMDSGDMCKVLETYNTSSDGEGFTDWYVPAAGQLWEINDYLADINIYLQSIGGENLTSDYFSSSELDNGRGWCVSFSGNFLSYYGKNSGLSVRFVRDISSKSIKKRILDLENNKANKDSVPEKTSDLINDSNFVVDDIYPDGVYAVTPDNKLINYNTADESCIGVAVIINKNRFMIAKEDATDGTNDTLFWGLYEKDIEDIYNYGTLNGTDNGGYLDGSIGDLSNDYTTWTDAMSDFNGKKNTEAIIRAYTEYGVAMDSRDMCKVLSTYNEGSYSDWYVPALGQLALIYLVKDDVDTALAKIGGTALSTSNGYWSSTEFSNSSNSWGIFFPWGQLYFNSRMGTSVRVRFIRDLSFVKSLNERVSELESSKQDTLINGTNIKTINGESILGSGDIIIEGGGNYLPISGGDLEGNLNIHGDLYVNSGIIRDDNSLKLSWNFSSLSVVNNTNNSELISIKTSGDGTKFLADDGTYKTISLSSGGGNVKAVDTGDVLDDVAVNYATTEYVDSVLGDINSILESIINGGKSMITFYINGTEHQAEEGMTWEEWIISDYYDSNDLYLAIDLLTPLKDAVNDYLGMDISIVWGGGYGFIPDISLQDIIISETDYVAQTGPQ